MNSLSTNLLIDYLTPAPSRSERCNLVAFLLYYCIHCYLRHYRCVDFVMKTVHRYTISMSVITNSRSLLIVSIVIVHISCDPGPKYPITASWFKDRFTLEEWNKTLSTFHSWGGDTVFLRAPPVIKRSVDDLARDPNFVWCGSLNSSTGVWGRKCWDEAADDLSALGVKIAAFATYQYEEGFGDSIMACPKFDRRLSSSRVYYRLVLPTVPQRFVYIFNGTIIKWNVF